MSEPTNFYSGDAVKWSRTLTSVVDTASYRLLSANSHYTVNADVDGLVLSVDIDSNTSSNFSAGNYKWYLIATVGSERMILGEGYVVIENDPTSINQLDPLTHAERVLTAIEARIEGRILSDHENYSIDGRSLTRIPIEQLNKIRRDYAWKVHDLQVKRGQKKKLKRVIHR